MAVQTRLKIRSSTVPSSVPTIAQLLPAELALNAADGILYSTDGVTVFEIGANTTNSVVQNTLTVNTVSANGTIGNPGEVLKSDGVKTYWDVELAGHGYYRGNNGQVGVIGNLQNIFRSNANTLNQNTTFLAGENALATGPITVAAGVTLTVNAGARVVIV